MRNLGESFTPTMKRKIRGMTEAERREAFNTVNHIPHTRVFKNKRGPKNDNLNKCLQLLEVRSMERGGDCSIRNEQLADLLGVSRRQVKTYILQLENQGFITALYADNPKLTPIHVADPDTFEPIKVNGKFVVHKTVSRRRTFRIIRCHRIIAKNNYEVPHRKVEANCRKFKPFKYDFRPPTETISFDKIPLQEYEKARLGDPAEVNAAILLKNAEYEKSRVDAMMRAYKNGMTIDQMEEKQIIPPVKPVQDLQLEDAFSDLYERMAKIGKYAGPVYDEQVVEMYQHFKSLQEIGNAEGIAILGKEIYVPKHLDAVPDSKAMYFTGKNFADSSRYVSEDDPDFLAKMMIGKTRAWAAKNGVVY